MAVVFGTQILVCGGLLPSGATTGSVVALDTRTMQVAPSGSLAAPVHDAGAASANGVALIFGGGNQAPVAIVQRVAPGSGSAAVGLLPEARADLSAVAIGSEMMVVAGGTPASPDPAVLTTVDGVQFRSTATLSIGVRYAAVAAVGGIVYVIGGATPNGDANAIQAIDPRTGAVRIAGHLPEGLSHASAIALGGEVLIAGGRSAGRLQSELWSFDPGTGSVRSVGRLPYAVSDAATATVDGVGYVIGGEGVGGLLRSIVSLGLR